MIDMSIKVDLIRCSTKHQQKVGIREVARRCVQSKSIICSEQINAQPTTGPICVKSSKIQLVWQSLAIIFGQSAHLSLALCSSFSL